MLNPRDFPKNFQGPGSWENSGYCNLVKLLFSVFQIKYAKEDHGSRESPRTFITLTHLLLMPPFSTP